jgi:hypothetical protein
MEKGFIYLILFIADPSQWTEDHTYRWAKWTVQEFNLNSVNLSLLRGFTGHRLCTLTSRQFLELAYIKEHGQTLHHCFQRIKALGETSCSIEC